MALELFENKGTLSTDSFLKQKTAISEISTLYLTDFLHSM